MALSITRDEAAEKSFNMASPTGNEEDGLTIPEVEEMIDEAAHMLCDRIRETKQYYRLHDATINVSVSAGVGTIPEDVMAESIPDSMGGRVDFVRADITDPVMRTPISYMPDFAKLKRARPGGNKLGYYAIYGSGDAGRLYVYSGLGQPCTGTATIAAAKYYTFETMPAQLEDEFVLTLADMARARLTSKGMMDANTNPANTP